MDRVQPSAIAIGLVGSVSWLHMILESLDRITGHDSGLNCNGQACQIYARSLAYVHERSFYP